MLTLELPKEVENRLTDLANETRQPKETLALKAIFDYLEFQNEELTSDDIDALREYQRNKSDGTLVTHSIDETRSRLSLDR